MRLLTYSDDGRLMVTPDIVDEAILPPYAILSHTWGEETDEVTFEDLEENIGKDKPGFKKIEFCREQAKRDGLKHFWIDTCCIDKANKAELSLAIRSMFRWYRNSNRCYVYLSDVSAPPPGAEQEANPLLRALELRASKWFTRGWTLQELLAPKIVEFFSREGHTLGDRASLKWQIHRATVIPHAALEGCLLSQFTVNERLGWIQNRQTKLEEDKAYSLSGVLGVELMPVYGEGANEAFRRLHNEVEKLEACLRDLRSTDPGDDKKRIEDAKGGLLTDSYCWVLDNAMFQQWHNDPQSQLLWIKGDPGKGKTMLLCGIIDELQKTFAKTASVSYFFCQATDSRINSATDVLRGVLYLLARQQPTIIAHVRKAYDQAGKSVFEDANAWVALTEIFADLLQDSSLGETYIIIDALDECVVNLPKLLQFVARHSSTSSRVKWIVSSRNLPHIEDQLESVQCNVRLSLELNAESVSAAVRVFIQHKVSQLAQQKKYDQKTQDAVFETLTSNANDTFLWVALVCQELEQTAKRNALKKLSSFPPGLNALYERMMQQIQMSDDAGLCIHILALTALLYRPITLEELRSLAEPLEDIADEEEVREIIRLCGSFLTLREDTVRFVHQSAQDFLFTEAFDEVFPSGIEAAHLEIFTRSLAVLSRTLRKDIYYLKEPGFPINDIQSPNPDPLVASRYSCIYWIDHLCQSIHAPQTDSPCDIQLISTIDEFFRTIYLYWLEGLSLCRSVAKGVVLMAKLVSLVQKWDIEDLTGIIRDAHRFIMYHRQVIESYPLQTYASALVFSPTGSAIRTFFKHEELEGITISPTMSEDWSACLQTLEDHINPVGKFHTDFVEVLAYSHDSTKLVSMTRDDIKLWDAISGERLQTITDLTHHFTSVAFSCDSTKLISASSNGTVRLWDTLSGECLQTLKQSVSVESLSNAAFSKDLTALAVSYDDSIELWDLNSGQVLQTLWGPTKHENPTVFSHDSTKLATISLDGPIKLWDTISGECLQTFSGQYVSVAFSSDSLQLATGSDDGTVRILDLSSGVCLQTLKGHGWEVRNLAFSHNSAQLASASYDMTITIWDSSTGICLQTLEGHGNSISSITFSPLMLHLASGSRDGEVKIWDTGASTGSQTLNGHSSTVTSLGFSQDLARLASIPVSESIKVWDVSGRSCSEILQADEIRSFTWSQDSTQLLTASTGGEIVARDICSGTHLPLFETEIGHVISMTLSHDSAQLAICSLTDSHFELWNVHGGVLLQQFHGHTAHVESVSFSHDSIYAASASYDHTVKIWDLSTGLCVNTLKGHDRIPASVDFSPKDPTKLASSSRDKTIRLWDVVSGACLQIINTGKTIYSLEFDPDGLHLRTDIGAIEIQHLGSSDAEGISESSEPLYSGINLTSDGLWIRYGNKNILWIPPEFRSYSSSVRGNVAAIGSNSGRVWLCTVDPDAMRVHAAGHLTPIDEDAHQSRHRFPAISTVQVRKS
ncbi:WD40-repeat-containing domain protein [Boeremia exigua]|uniref:WD40-repeat-containing domain protein n=1 Tax=Boeremia exigua TaxID=749465 RepID=UPI001E8E58D4|nr:WD40-repeat-containing domain protein [Boeremia exigua]KAH6639423.1 WD40-repeat-containing domain protein [Boeremia exigua]